MKWYLRNGRVLAEDRGAVIVSNHQSSIDILGKSKINYSFSIPFNVLK